MQRKRSILTVFAVLFAVIILGGYVLSQGDERPEPKVAPVANRKAAAAQPQLKPAPEALPIAQVVLFNSGVGYFQREGTIEGASQVTLPFQSSDINDLLKSLVLEDADGGKVSAISYDSQDPLDKILRSFALDLNNNPSYSDLLQQARGEKVEITLTPTDKAPPTTISGTIVGMETRKSNGVHLVGTVPAAPLASESSYLNVLAEDGIKSLALDRVQRVRFLNQTLASELQRALQVVAQAHDTQKKNVSFAFQGAGKRTIRIGYVVERPIWKMTYRLRLEPNGKLFLQGWALVENTSDTDWSNVGMTLVSGRPISYKMDLYQPLYIPRPVVEPELFASLRPQTYSGTIDPRDGRESTVKRPAKASPSEPMPDSNIASNVGRGQVDHLKAMKKQMEKVGEAKEGREERFLRDLDFEVGPPVDAKKIGGKLAGLNFKEGIASVASAADIGDYFQYRVAHKVTIPRQKSAMLPIFNETIEGSKVSIYNAAVHAKYPLLGLKLKNTSGQPLTQGPVTVFDEGTYAGDTRLLDVQPKEERLVSYALDQGTEVMSSTELVPSPAMLLGIKSEQLTAKFTMLRQQTYTLKNRSPQDRVVIVEHPISDSWKLVAPPKDLERTRDVYRFIVKVAKGETVKHLVSEEQELLDHFTLADGTPVHAVATGIEIKQVVKASPPELLELKIKKGLLYPKLRQRESRTYYIQNQSKEDRSVTIDYTVRAEWTRLDPKGDQKGPAVHRFTVTVAKEKAALQEVVEEHISTETTLPLKEVSEVQLREYLSHQAPSKAVKDALAQVLEQRSKIAETAEKLAETSTRLKVLSEDQARLRENLKIIPQNSEPYKAFLDKFVKREAEIETAQTLQRELQETHTTLQRRYELLLATLHAD